MSNHVCEICRPRSFQHVHWAMKRKAFITVATARSPDPSCWYPRSHVGRSLPPYLALPPSVPPPPAHSSQLLWPSRCRRRTLRSLFPPVQAPFPLRRHLPTRPPSLSRYSSLPPGLCSKATASETSSYPFGHSSPWPTPRVSARANRTPVLPTPRSGHPWWVNTDPCRTLTPQGSASTAETSRLVVWFCSSESQLSSVGKDLANPPPRPLSFSVPLL